MGETPDRYAALPKHLAAAAAAFHDADGRLLLVKPTYRDDWLLPGGAMDPDEYPLQTVRREVAEELGIELKDPARLLVVDWMQRRPDGRPALVAFVFDGGRMTDAKARSQLRLPPDELSTWRFADSDEWDDLVAPRVARRLHACREAIDKGTTLYLEDGMPVP